MPRGTAFPSSSCPDRSLWPTTWKLSEVPGVPPPDPTPTSPKATSGKASASASRNRTSRRGFIAPPLTAVRFQRLYTRRVPLVSKSSDPDRVGQAPGSLDRLLPSATSEGGQHDEAYAACLS